MDATLRNNTQWNVTGNSSLTNLTLDQGVIRYQGAAIAITAANPVQLAAGGGTIDTNGFNQQFAPVLAGPGALTKGGAGTLTLATANTYTGGTTIAAGTLQLGNGGTTGSIIGDVVDNGVLAFNRSDVVTFGAAISGSGAVDQVGSGATILTGANSNLGATTVTGGSLFINGDQSGATGLTTALAGTLLGGSGVIGGDVVVADGATLYPGNVGPVRETLTINGDLRLSGGSLLDYEFGAANLAGGALNDLVNVGGDLVLDGTLNVSVTPGGAFDLGVYRVINYLGALTNNGLAIGAAPALASQLFVQTSIPGQVNLAYTGGLNLTYWDGAAGPKNDGVVNGGDGPWQNSTGNDNWTIGNGANDGQINAPWADAAFAVFQGAPGTVTVDNSLGAVTASGMQFVVDGYTVTGDVLTLVGPQSQIRVGDGTLASADMTATIAAQLAGNSQLVKTDIGTLVLTGANTYDGGTLINGGVLQVASDGNLGVAAGSLILDSGVLRTTADMTTVRATTLEADGGTFETAAGTTLTHGGVITGPGDLTKDGAGTLTLTGANTYVGGTTITAGTLQLGAGGTTGSIIGDVVDNGVLTFNRSDSVTFGGAISGSGAVDQVGSGTTILTGDSSYTGGTTITAGTLQLGDGGATGSITGEVLNNGALIFNRSDAVAFAGAITGSGSVSQIGAGTTILTGASSYSGGTTITAGTLQLGDGGTTGSITGDVVDNGALAFDRSDAVTFAGVITGSGAVAQIGAGATTLTGANTYAGGTTITAGTLQLGAGGTTGSITGDVANNGVLTFNRSDIVTFGGAISGAGAVRQAGSGTTILTGASSYSGGTTITAGTLQLGDGGTTGSITGDVVDNGVLAFGRSDAVTFGGAITGSGAVAQIGAGVTILTGANTYAGGTTITAGTLQLGAGGTTGSITGDVVNNGALAFNRSDVVTFAGAISGAGVVRQAGSGTTVLTGANIYSGVTQVSAGTLQAGAANRFSAASAHQVLSGATLATGGFNQTVAALANAGTVRLAAGDSAAPGTVLSVTGDYVGQGGTLVFNTVLGGDASATDLLKIAGASTGSSLVRVNNIGGAGAQTDVGIKLVDVAGASPGVFQLLGDFTTTTGQSAVVAGAYAYTLNQNSRTGPADGDWYLRSELTTPDVPPGPDPVPAYNPGTPLYENYAQALLALNTLPTLRQRVGEWTRTGAEAPTFAKGGAFWGRIDAGYGRSDPAKSSLDVTRKHTAYVANLGADFTLTAGEDGSALVAGVNGRYGVDTANVSSIQGLGRIKSDVAGLGATLTWYGASGFYADAQAAWDWYSSDLDARTAGRKMADGNDGHGYAVSLETGWKRAISDKLMLTPQAQLTYSKVGFDDFSDAFDARVSGGEGESLRGRLGLAMDSENRWVDANGRGASARVYAIANLYYEFLDGAQVAVSDADDADPVVFFNREDRLWGGLGMGGTRSWNDEKISLYGEANLDTSLQNPGRSYAVTARIGLRIKW